MTAVARLLACGTILHVMHFEEDGDCSCRQLKNFPGLCIFSCCIVKVLQILVQFLKACGNDFVCNVASVTWPFN